MKRKSLKALIAWLRVCIFAFLAAIASLLLFSFTPNFKPARDLWKQLGLSSSEGNGRISQGVMHGFIYHYGIRTAKNILVNEKVEMVKDLCSYTKEYLRSTESREAYKLFREDVRPLPLAGEPADAYHSRLQNWKNNYPAKIDLFIAMRLRQFLESTEGVDFEAKLVVRNGVKVFADPVYEAKSSNWKLAYRAGREATETARSFALQWLAEIS